MSRTQVRLIIEQEGKVLLLRQTPKNGGAFTLAGGKIEAGETAIQALIRESWEEAGIILREDDLQLVHTMLQIKGKRHRFILFFKAIRWTGVLASREPDKFKEVVWQPLDALPQSTNPRIVLALHYYRQGLLFSELDARVPTPGPVWAHWSPR